MESYTLELKRKNQVLQVAIKEQSKKTLLELLREQGIELFAYCGGRGTCGKCKVLVTAGDFPITEEDKKSLSLGELEQGYRLACKAVPKGNCSVQLEEEKEEYEILGVEKGQSIQKEQRGEKGQSIQKEQGVEKEQRVEKKRGVTTGRIQLEEVQVAIDIGTTTMAFATISSESLRILESTSVINPLRAYGADVVSRMEASNSGKREEMKKKLQEGLLEGIRTMLRKARIPYKALKRVVIAGNTTMGHLLMGYSCEGLGNYPFTPENIGFIRGTIGEILGGIGFFQGEVVLLPGVSAFVGADISAGMYYKRMAQAKGIQLLVDLGTNGEMAIGNENGILTTSAAAGPAFEGGNISCGMGSVRGAISKVEIDGETPLLTTIGDGAPLGLCGTGVLDVVSELRRNKLIDETGLFKEKYLETGFLLGKTSTGKELYFTQKDIREIQLAKAAIRAGIELLLKRYGVTYEDIEHVYLAGGFGFKLDVEKAAGMGLIPKELSKRVEAIGNSSLLGAIQFIGNPKGEESFEKLIALCEEKHLATDDEFQEIYLASMYFA